MEIKGQQVIFNNTLPVWSTAWMGKIVYDTSSSGLYIGRDDWKLIAYYDDINTYSGYVDVNLNGLLNSLSGTLQTYTNTQINNYSAYVVENYATLANLNTVSGYLQSEIDDVYPFDISMYSGYVSNTYATKTQLDNASGVILTNIDTALSNASGILQTAIYNASGTVLETANINLFNASGMLQNSIYSTSGSILNTANNNLYNASGSLLGSVYSTSGTLQTAIYNTSGTILTMVNSNMYNASGVLRSYTDAVSGGIASHFHGDIAIASGAAVVTAVSQSTTILNNASGVLVSAISAASGAAVTNAVFQSNVILNNASGLFLKKDGSVALSADWNAGNTRKITSQSLSADYLYGAGGITDSAILVMNNMSCQKRFYYMGASGIWDDVPTRHDLNWDSAYSWGDWHTPLANASGLFLKKDGTIPLTANWNAGYFTIQASGLVAAFSSNGTTPQIKVINSAGVGNGTSTYCRSALRTEAGGIYGKLQAVNESAGAYGSGLCVGSETDHPLNFITNNNKVGSIDTTGNMIVSGTLAAAGGQMRLSDNIANNPWIEFGSVSNAQKGSVSLGQASPYNNLTLTASGATGTWKGAVDVKVGYNGVAVYTPFSIRATATAGIAQTLIGVSGQTYQGAYGSLQCFDTGATSSIQLRLAGLTAKTFSSSVYDGIILDTTYTGQSITWNAAKISWGYSAAIAAGGAKMALSTVNTAGNFQDVLNITGSGYVGINTLNPRWPFEIYNSAYSIMVLSTGAGNANYRDWSINAGGDAQGALSFQCGGSAGTDPVASANTKLMLTSTGGIKIGSPVYTNPRVSGQIWCSGQTLMMSIG